MQPPENHKNRERDWLNAEGAPAFRGHQWPSMLLHVIHNITKTNGKVISG